MAKIRALASEVIAQIAAGEVVERLASVVKELVENAIDARCIRVVYINTEGGVTMAKNVLTESFSEPLTDATTAVLDIHAGYGNLTIDGLAGGEPVLAAGVLQYLETQDPPARTLVMSGGQATLTLDQRHQHRGRPQTRHWDAVFLEFVIAALANRRPRLAWAVNRQPLLDIAPPHAMPPPDSPPTVMGWISQRFTTKGNALIMFLHCSIEGRRRAGLARSSGTLAMSADRLPPNGSRAATRRSARRRPSCRA